MLMDFDDSGRIGNLGEGTIRTEDVGEIRKMIATGGFGGITLGKLLCLISLVDLRRLYFYGSPYFFVRPRPKVFELSGQPMLNNAACPHLDSLA
jgi:hypothetical protein